MFICCNGSRDLHAQASSSAFLHHDLIVCVSAVLNETFYEHSIIILAIDVVSIDFLIKYAYLVLKRRFVIKRFNIINIVLLVNHLICSGEITARHVKAVVTSMPTSPFELWYSIIIA